MGEGEWMGIKPTGKVVVYTGVNINRIINGLIMEHGGAANVLGLKYSRLLCW
jgi:predicted ester cyclase